MKKSYTVILAILMLCILCSCGNTNAGQASADPIPKYTAEELNVTSNSGSQGIYILNIDGTFSPLVKDFDGYQGLSAGDTYSRYLWFTENSDTVLEKIPHFTKGSELVLLYNTESAIPNKFVLEKYDYKGYTLGCHFYRTEDSRIYLSTKGTLDNTYAASALNTMDDEEDYLVSEINESSDLPIKNIDNNLEMLLGLEGGKIYKVGFYKGTKFRQMTTYADTQVFQSAGTFINIEGSHYYERTTKGYFVVNMPDNLEEGYYYVTGLGMIYYEGE